jgi:hypothetical protein
MVCARKFSSDRLILMILWSILMGLKPPHILLASSNPLKMLSNLQHILDADAYNSLKNEIDENVKSLFELGESHYLFAKQLTRQHWRQRISRFYYGAYNVRRSISLHENGSYGTEVDDHKKTSLPNGFNNSSTYSIQLHTLRDDRNLSDYDHTAVELDLVITQDEAEILVADFLHDARTYLTNRGFIL